MQYNCVVPKIALPKKMVIPNLTGKTSFLETRSQKVRRWVVQVGIEYEFYIVQGIIFIRDLIEFRRFF